MLLASKYEEIYAPAVDEFVYISDNTYTREQVRAGCLKELSATKTFVVWEYVETLPLDRREQGCVGQKISPPPPWAAQQRTSERTQERILKNPPEQKIKKDKSERKNSEGEKPLDGKNEKD